MFIVHVYLCVCVFICQRVYSFPKYSFAWLSVPVYVFFCFAVVVEAKTAQHLPCNCSAMQLPVMCHRVEFGLPAYSLGVDDAVAADSAFEYSGDRHFHRVCHRSVPIIHDILHFVRCNDQEIYS